MAALGPAFALLALWLVLAPAAEAAVPPSPVVTTPATADFVVQVSSQPIHFEGTVVGPVGPNDRIFVANFTANPGDPPLRCNILLSGSTAWSCDGSPAEVVGDYELRVSWFAPDAPYGDISAPTVLTVHVVPDVVPPAAPPTASPTPKPKPKKTPKPEESPTEPVATLLPPLPPSATAAPPAAAPAEPLSPEVAPPPTTTPVLGPWDPTAHPKQVMGLGIATFTLLTVIGPAGLALSGAATSGLALAAAASGAAGVTDRKKGKVTSAKTKSTKFSASGSGAGDRSVSWRAPGWRAADAWGTRIPLWLAPRSPLPARILADGGYLRAMFGSIWMLGAAGCAALGVVAAHDSGGAPIPPSLALTAALLMLAIFDATWGALGVAGFAAGLIVWHSNQLALAPSIRSFLGLAALWFAIPLIAAASRPFRRPVAMSTQYRWDRLGDGIIAALIAGWATQKTVGGLPGLSGLDLPIAPHANQLALLAIATVVVRLLVEEFAAQRYPLRLDAAGLGKLPAPGHAVRLFNTGVRAALFVFLTVAFIGPCWQLWVGAAMFALPQVLSIYEDAFPNSERLKAILPVGLVNILVGLVIGTLSGRLVFAILERPDSILRNGFVLLALPGLALSLFGLFGREGPDPRWTWPRQAMGVLVMGVTVWLIVTGW